MKNDRPCSRRDFLKLSACGAAALSLGSSFVRAEAPQARPNVIVILADDAGWGDFSCYPQDRTQLGAALRTPNIDSLAAEGVRFTQGYATAPVCTPSRAGLLSGRYQQRFGWYEFIEAERGFPAGVTLLSEFMHAQGYATACIGKWHLGYADEVGPLKHGFDRFWGTMGGQHDYFDPRLGDPLTAMSFDYDAWVRDQERHVEQMGYMTDELTRHALEFIATQARAKQPFFLYLPYTAPHPPMQATWEKLKPYADAQGHFTTRDITRAMLDSMDEGIGRILQLLLHLGIDENTLIFFSSDNGGVDDRDGQPLVQHNGGLRPRKGFLWEGGIRVPYIMRWPKRLKEGQVYSQPVSLLDVFATVAAAVAPAAAPANLDGVDLVPYLRGERQGVPHDTLYWGFQAETQQFAVRHGDWKLARCIVDYKAQRETPMRMELALYNLADDPAETSNLLQAQPKIARELQAMWDAFIGGCPPSIFTPADRQHWQAALKARKEKLPDADRLRRDGAPGHWL
jgi:arylsulfatase A-like enzyme